MPQGSNFDPGKILACMMQREKRHSPTEPSVAVGTAQVAVQDAVAKIEDRPLHAVLANRYSNSQMAVPTPRYVAGS